MAEAIADAAIAIFMLGFPIALAISFGYVIGGVVLLLKQFILKKI